MGFPKKLLTDDEEIVLDLRPHWVFMAAPTAALIGAVVLGIVIVSQDPDGFLGDALRWSGVGLIVFCLGWFGVRYARWVSTQFVLTTERVISRHGIIAKHGIEIPLDRINTVFFEQRFIERLFGAGDLGIESAGERGMQRFSDIRRPSIVQAEIYRQAEANQTRIYHGRPAAARDASIPEQIEQLDELRRRGVLSQAEFDAKKAELLGRM